MVRLDQSVVTGRLRALAGTVTTAASLWAMVLAELAAVSVQLQRTSRLEISSSTETSLQEQAVAEAQPRVKLAKHGQRVDLWPIT
jgi:hypothetical protein